ncbi:MAG: HNH endonuclease [Cyanobacteria bacterium RI_101]|nr:HNH endonuclease [Cyanobacteria bacterium RI_101]
MPIDAKLKQAIRERANYYCEYCHSPERLSASRFTIDHILPRSLGGFDDPDNLALACRRCNERRYDFVAGVDPSTQAIIPLFNPRQFQWQDHFIWAEGGIIILGQTPMGRASCLRLDLNDERYPEADSIRATRKLWMQIGYHPPVNDPCQA